MDWYDEMKASRERGDRLAREGRYDEALGCYRRALALCPGEAGTASIEEELERLIHRCAAKQAKPRRP